MAVVSWRQVTSLSNDTVKAARALHMRKARDETGEFLAEGLKIITEAVEQGVAPRVLMFGRAAASHPLLIRAAEATVADGGEVIEVTPEILEKVARRENAQPAVAIFRQSYQTLHQLNPASNGCWVAMQQVRDPGNLGTIMHEEGFFRTEEEHARYVADLYALHEDRGRMDLAWRFGLDRQVLDTDTRLTEIRNFINLRVKPAKSARGRA
jgi:hypothetical protein